MNTHIGSSLDPQDWFRYELLGRHLMETDVAAGWVDADSFSLRNLGEVLEARLERGTGTGLSENDHPSLG